jgi:hypothetical protein
MEWFQEGLSVGCSLSGSHLPHFDEVEAQVFEAAEDIICWLI